jgi:hypothetical protein
LRLVTAGVAIGSIASRLLGRAIEVELERDVKPYDPLTLAGTTLLLVLTGRLACLDSGEKSSASGSDGGPAL